MNSLELNSLERCIAHRDAMGPGYLDTCLAERMFSWFHQNPDFVPNLLLIFGLLLIGSLLLWLVKYIHQNRKTEEAKRPQ
jgi:hypothetical protein